MKKIIGQQGEVVIIKLDKLPEMETRPVHRSCNGYIISHSESGNHHILTDGEVMEQVDNVPNGMRVLYAILKNPAKLKQDTAKAHGEYSLPPGIYSFKISREHDPFLEQARIVND